MWPGVHDSSLEGLVRERFIYLSMNLEMKMIDICPICPIYRVDFPYMNGTPSYLPPVCVDDYDIPPKLKQI